MVEESHNRIAVNPDDIPTYSKAAFFGSWTGRSRAMWGVAAMGIIFGALTGLIAPFFPVLVGAQTLLGAVELIPTSVAIFSAGGMLAGFTVGAINGVVAGAASGTAKEFERRIRAHEIDLGVNPGKETEVSTSPSTATKTPEKKPPSTWEEMSYINLRVGAVVALFGAIGGLILSAAYNLGMGAGDAAVMKDAALPAMKTLLGEAAATNPTAITSYLTGLMTTFGALWCFNFPKIANAFQDVAGRIMSGELLGTQWGPAKEKTLQKAAAPEPLSLPAPPENAAAEWMRPVQSVRFQEMVASRRAATDEQGLTLGL